MGASSAGSFYGKTAMIYPITIAHVIGCIDARIGGPAYSLNQLCAHLKQQNAESHIFSFHYPFDDRGMGWDGLAVQHLRDCSVGRLLAGWNPYAFRELLEKINSQKIQIVHNQGLWIFPNQYARLAAQKYKLPLITSVRGMLETWTLKQNGFKKKIAWVLYEKKNLDSVDVFHATSEQEADSIRRLGFRQPIAIIPNGVLSEFVRGPVVYPERILLFLSRIDQKKGIERLLLIWRKIFKQFPDWRLVIAGEGNKTYVANLKKKAVDSGLGASVVWTGFVEKEKKKKLFNQAELFILPSFSENFGNVVAEALSFGVPVITTQGTPWEILRTEKCGWWVKNDEIELENALRASMMSAPAELFQMGQRGHQLVQSLYAWPKLAQDMLEVYEWMLQQREKPDCVRLD